MRARSEAKRTAGFVRRSGFFLAAALLAVFAVGLLSCEKKGRDNPLDPEGPGGVHDLALTASAGDCRITLSWNGVPGGHVAGYQLYRRDTTAGGAFRQLVSLGGGTTSFVDVRVKRGHQYDYLIRATDRDGEESAASSGAWATISSSGEPCPGWVPEEFVLLNAFPPATFTMGSPSSEPGRDSDETQHQVTLTRSFYVSQYEVTQSEWESVMGWNESDFRGSSRPVERVTWYDAVSYCNKRSQAEGLTPAYTITGASYSGNHIVSATVSWNQSAAGYRLLTEAEWEYACRAGTQTAFCNGGITNIYCDPVDPNLNQVGWYCGNAGSTTHDVGGKSPNGWGLYDIHGNVWEWCWDWYGSYGGTVTDPTGPGSGSDRVLRGGSWGCYARYCRSAFRYGSTPGARTDDLGFRLARNVP